MKHVLLSTGIKQKPIAREIMILLIIAITLGTAVGTNAEPAHSSIEGLLCPSNGVPQ